MEELTKWLIFFAWCVLVCGVVILSCVKITHDLDKTYIEAGYTKQSVIGYDYPIWTKGAVN